MSRSRPDAGIISNRSDLILSFQDFDIINHIFWQIRGPSAGDDMAVDNRRRIMPDGPGVGHVIDGSRVAVGKSAGHRVLPRRGERGRARRARNRYADRG